MEYTEQVIQQVWEHGRAIGELDANEWRQDQCGAWIRRDQYEHTQSEYGWQIHSLSAGDVAPEHLRPFQHQNAVDGAGQVQCHITADRTDIQPTAQIDQPHNKPA